MTVVGLDDLATWPAAARELWERRAEDVRDTAEYLDELGLSIETEDDFRVLLSGTKVRAFHATRLLDHEVAGIREVGLRRLTVELVPDRVNQAFRHGADRGRRARGLRTGGPQLAAAPARYTTSS